MASSEESFFGDFIYSPHPVDDLESDGSTEEVQAPVVAGALATVALPYGSAPNSVNVVVDGPTAYSVGPTDASFVEDNEAPLLFVEPPSEQLVCRLCQKVYKDPVIAACGDTFCRPCIQLKLNAPCPLDGNALQILVPNKLAWDQVSQLRIRCRHGLRATASDVGWEPDPHGCQEQIRLGFRREHEDDCGFAHVNCPNSRSCPPMLKKNLEHHLQICENCKCSNAKFGCTFSGKGDDLALHAQSCAFRAVSSYLQELYDKMNDLSSRVKQNEEQHEFLTNMLGKLTERVDRMEHALELKIDAARKDLSINIREQMRGLEDEINTFSRGWDPQQAFRCRGTFVGHQGPVWCLCVYQDLLFSGSSDKTIKVWDLSTNYRCVKTLEGHQGIVLALCVFGGKLFSGSQDNNIVVWNLESFLSTKTIAAHDNPVCTLACARNMLFSGSLKVIKVWNADTLELMQEMKGLTHWVRALVATHTYLYCGSNKTIKVWDLDTFECVRSLDTQVGSVYSIAVTQHHILCGTNENSIHAWAAGSAAPESPLVGHSGTVYALAALQTATGIKAFSASFDRAIRVWSMDNMICTQTLIRHQGSVTSLVISRGRVFSGSVDMTIKVWQ